MFEDVKICQVERPNVEVFANGLISATPPAGDGCSA
jgi:hypothetical protein